MLLTNAQEAGLTRSRRHAKGKYQTPSQKAVYIKYLAGGMAALTANDIALLAANPYLSPVQRAKFAALAGAK
jgi:chromosome segregation and condensation protein ScpB